MKRKSSMNKKIEELLEREGFPTEVYFNLFDPLESKSNEYTFVEFIRVNSEKFVAKVTDKENKVLALKFYYEPDEPACYYEKKYRWTV